MKKLSLYNLLALLSVTIVSILFLSACSSDNKSADYETADNDPLNARVYTLDNGLKVYLTVYKDAPRIQTYVAVRAGGKNDPAETTGLAHYFEHLMFKGTKQFGTTNYDAEKPMLDQIEALFEQYRKTTDPTERKAIYHQIDSISQEASKYNIPNEYDKLMAAIGAQGTNAFTSNDITCYVEDIPSNQIENWAKVQSDRFKNCVIRGFHTELEAVYEEKNLSMTRDNEKLFETMMANLFPFHPYGTQTVIGTQEQLKNPSITNIKKFFETYYVANNIAICMSGDFDPDEVIKVIKQYFGDMRTNKDIPDVVTQTETPITTPIATTVLGNDAESIMIAWRAPGDKDKERTIAQLTDYIFCNGQAGIFDLNVTQKQLALYPSAGYDALVDYGMYIMTARPKAGQTLDQVKDVLLQQMQLLRNGDFPDWLLDAAKNNLKLNYTRSLENNSQRARQFLDAFASNIDWKDYSGYLERLAKLTKQDVINYANKYYNDNNYTVLYKKTGKDPNEKVIEKPQITPIAANRDNESKFLADIKNSVVKPIEPVFLDFKKDLQVGSINNVIQSIYKKNTENDLFNFYYIFDMGRNADKVLAIALDYLQYIGTSDMTPEQVQSEFYKLGCSFNTSASEDRTYIMLDGLQENMDKAVQLMQKMLSDPVPNQDAFDNLINDVIKKRADSKLNQNSIFYSLARYAAYGKLNPRTYILNNTELKALTPDILIAKIKELSKYQHTIAYYGPADHTEVTASIVNYHPISNDLIPPLPNMKFEPIQPKENLVFFAPYDANQVLLFMRNDEGRKFNAADAPIISMFNEYFGGGMNSIVFQEIREARGLAYSAYAYYMTPSKKDECYTFQAYVATQLDKMDDAVKTFQNIINNIPMSDKAFDLAKQGLINQLRTSRTTKSDIIWAYLDAKDLGLSEPTDKQVFEKVQQLTLNDVQKFQEQYIKDRKYHFAIATNPKTINFKQVEQYGKITKLSLPEIFGY
ncbi:MAG: insulinase family protein [Ignavibacteria bacterium]|jgi:predicted Zn-dependent peptidase|nr:insulinase family protein [Ignavibacteria bacterium]